MSELSEISLLVVPMEFKAIPDGKTEGTSRGQWKHYAAKALGKQHLMVLAFLPRNKDPFDADSYITMRSLTPNDSLVRFIQEDNNTGGLTAAAAAYFHPFRDLNGWNEKQLGVNQHHDKSALKVSLSEVTSQSYTNCFHLTCVL
jgi:hypothetical protein